jgi:hypothetical protein
MNSFTPNIFRAIRYYTGKVQSMREEVRTERLLNSLPASIRKDIGWPDSYPERRARRN